MSIQATGTFEAKSWDEQPYDEMAGGPKLSRGQMINAFTGDIEGEGRSHALMAYRADGAVSFVSLERLSGRIGGRSGSFVLQHSGVFDLQHGTAKASWLVVPGSGAEQLCSLHGEGYYEWDRQKHGLFTPFSLNYNFEPQSEDTVESQNGAEQTYSETGGLSLTHTQSTFEIMGWDQTPYDESVAGLMLARATVKKIFRGQLEGESTAELLMCQGANDSAGYVALERVVGRLGDRSGSFVIVHNATRGGVTSKASWFVVPGSGTGELRGLRGQVEYRHDAHEAVLTLDYAFE